MQCSRLLDSTGWKALAVVTALFFSTSAFAVTSFTGTYKAASDGLCLYTYSMSGKEPDAAGAYPVFIQVVGTTESYTSSHAMKLVTEMANRGFVAASVEYANSSFGSCSTIGDRTRCIFNSSNPDSAVSKLCARAKADCSKGIVVAGFSQGSVIATLAKNYDSRVRAAYAKGTFTSYSIYNLDSCMNNGNHTLASTDLRVMNGENDTFGGGSLSSVRTESQDVTGLSCGSTATSCLRADGSGWYIIRNTQVSDGNADHCYMRYGGCVDGLDPVWSSTTDPWGVSANLDWLKSRVTP